MSQRATKMVNSGVSAGTALGIGGDTQDNIVAAGATQATATPIYADNCIVVTAAAGTGVILSGPSFSAGDEIMVHNLGANALLVYPPLGGQINALAVNAGFSVATGKRSDFTVRTDATKFIAGVSA